MVFPPSLYIFLWVLLSGSACGRTTLIMVFSHKHIQKTLLLCLLCPASCPISPRSLLTPVPIYHSHTDRPRLRWLSP